MRCVPPEACPVPYRRALTIDVRLKREQMLREMRRWSAAVTVQAWVRGAAARRAVVARGGGKWSVRRRWLCRLLG
jgi:hypothetical protein